MEIEFQREGKSLRPSVKLLNENYLWKMIGILSHHSVGQKNLWVGIRRRPRGAARGLCCLLELVLQTFVFLLVCGVKGRDGRTWP